MFDKLVEYFLKFPGIGPRQAKRFAYFLSSADNEFVDELSKLIKEIKNNAVQCVSCRRYFENSKNDASNRCPICSSLNRNGALLMVVEKNLDLDNIEKTGIYNGKYFILGSALSLKNEKQNTLIFKELFNKAQKEKPAEVILATSATLEGENTARYIEKILEPLPVKVTRLGRGLSTGTELEYIDSETMDNALKNRK